MVGKNFLLVLVIFLCLIVSTGITTFATETNMMCGYLGYELYYEINATQYVEIGCLTNVDCWFWVDSDISDVEIYVSLEGAGVSYERTWNQPYLKTDQSILETIPIQPTEEGDIVCMIWAFYWDDVYQDWEYGQTQAILLEVKKLTYEDLLGDNVILKDEYTKLTQKWDRLVQAHEDLENTQLSLEEKYANLSNTWEKLVQKNEANLKSLSLYRNIFYVFVVGILVLSTICVWLGYEAKKRKSMCT